MKRAQPERALQKAVAEYLSHALPPDAFFSSIPGGEGRATRTPGYRAGTPDLMVIYPETRPLFFELKSKRGGLSSPQAAALNAIDRAGGAGYMVRSVEDVAFWLSKNGIPLRARVAAWP